MKTVIRYYFDPSSQCLCAEDEAGDRFFLLVGGTSWISDCTYTSKHLQPDKGISFDTIWEALEYWPDHRYFGWKCSELEWFEKYMQTVMKELL